MKEDIRKSFKFRIYLSKAQITNLENQFSMCRYLYNQNLTERIETYQKENIGITYNQQQNKLPELKKERPWFKSVYSQVLQDVLKRLDLAYKHFFRRVKNSETPGFPKCCPKPIQDKETGQYLPNRASIKAGLNKSIADVSQGRFLDILKYKAHNLGKKTISVSPNYTSQKCSQCGNIVKKSLSIRTHKCDCGFVANRDYNAALNIMSVGLDTLTVSTVKKPLLNL